MLINHEKRQNIFLFQISRVQMRQRLDFRSTASISFIGYCSRQRRRIAAAYCTSEKRRRSVDVSAAAGSRRRSQKISVGGRRSVVEKAHDEIYRLISTRSIDWY
uniref:Ribosomal protein S14 n=1 Tax=Romanomermis culicivorax TaxID=13658 RepID=A0A915HUF8_ROMCU